MGSITQRYQSTEALLQAQQDTKQMMLSKVEQTYTSVQRVTHQQQISMQIPLTGHYLHSV